MLPRQFNPLRLEPKAQKLTKYPAPARLRLYLRASLPPRKSRKSPPEPLERAQTALRTALSRHPRNPQNAPVVILRNPAPARPDANPVLIQPVRAQVPRLRRAAKIFRLLQLFALNRVKTTRILRAPRVKRPQNLLRYRIKTPLHLPFPQNHQKNRPCQANKARFPASRTASRPITGRIPPSPSTERTRSSEPRTRKTGLEEPSSPLPRKNSPCRPPSTLSLSLRP